MTRKYIAVYLLACILLVFYACSKNDINYSLDNVNTVSIKTEDSSFAVTQLDTLRIITELTESKPSGQTYSYEWKAFQVGDSAHILSTKKDFEEQVTLAPGDYDLIYTITNNETLVKSYWVYDLTVNGAFYEGWMISNTKDGEAQLSFIRADDVVFLNPAATINNTVYPGAALSSFYASEPFSGSILTMFFTDQGLYRFTPDDFVQIGTTTDVFTNGMEFSGVPIYGINGGAYDQYIINKGGLYAGLGPAFFGQDMLKPFSERFTGDYNLFPAILNPTGFGTTYFYDNEGKRFMQVSLLARNIEPVSGNPADAYNMANVGKTMISYDEGALNPFFGNEYYFVMKDDMGTARYLYSLNAGVPEIAQEIENSPGIESAVSFATSGVAKHMYYGVENRIYLYDMLANSSRLIYSLPENYNVEALKIDHTTSRILVAGANDGENGEVYFFDLDNLGNVIGDVYSRKFSGFGKIVHLSRKSA